MVSRWCFQNLRGWKDYCEMVDALIGNLKSSAELQIQYNRESGRNHPGSPSAGVMVAKPMPVCSGLGNGGTSGPGE